MVRVMGRQGLISRQMTLALRVTLTVVALAVFALLSPADWRRHFGSSL
jgi:hypothetical protein